MLLETRNYAGYLIVKVMAERLDAKNAVEFKEQISDIISEGNERILLNLEGVEFVDSSGLGAIVTCLKKLGGKGELAIYGVKKTVYTMFRLTRMDRVFQIFPTEELALSQIT
ncbi:MAG: STAS domain-containing protein [Candidatus Dadabacteria bacterium]|nr:STAS domain-containing protein [Candidatus Dadabacteria bacterium]